MLPKAFKSWPKSNKTPDLVTLFILHCDRWLRFCREIGHFLSPAMPQSTTNSQRPATSLNEALPVAWSVFRRPEWRESWCPLRWCWWRRCSTSSQEASRVSKICPPRNRRPTIRIEYWAYSSVVCTNHPAALGSNPKHTIYGFCSICIVEIGMGKGRR